MFSRYKSKRAKKPRQATNAVRLEQEAEGSRRHSSTCESGKAPGREETNHVHTEQGRGCGPRTGPAQQTKPRGQPGASPERANADTRDRERALPKEQSFRRRLPPKIRTQKMTHGEHTARCPPIPAKDTTDGPARPYAAGLSPLRGPASHPSLQLRHVKGGPGNTLTLRIRKCASKDEGQG